MAIPSTTDFRTEGSLGEVENIEMTIDENGMQFLMSILTNLYEDPTLAVVREYSTNAVDAHIDAGYDGPVEITLPTTFQKNFIVRDYGPGMDLEDIRNTYSKYVASTKRQSNTQAGMFGIGAKSALALGDTFTVESIKQGHKIVVAVLREGRGKASMKVMQHNVPTSEPDGTTIKVPAKHPYMFERAAKRYYKYVKRGVFTVDGKEWGEDFGGVKVNDDLYALPIEYHNPTSYIVMGNVPYPVNINDERAVVKYVDPGTFEPTPPREGLERTNDFEDRIKGFFDEAAAGLSQSTTDNIKDMSIEEATGYLISNYDTLKRWKAFDKVSYDGKRMDSKFKLDKCVRLMGSSSFAPEAEAKFGDYLLGAHVTEFDGKTKADINQYACQKAWGARTLTGYPDAAFLHYGGSTPKYCKQSRIITWDKAKQSNSWGGYSSRRQGATVQKAGDDWKVPTRKAKFIDSDNTPTFPKGSTKIVPFADWKGDDDDRQLVYFSPTELNTQARVNLINVLFDDADTLLVIKYVNQHDKTKEVTPEAKHFSEVGKEMAKKLVKQYGDKAFADVSMNWDRKYDFLAGDLFDKVRAIKRQVENDKAKHKVTGEQTSLVRSFAKDSLTTEVEFDTLVGKVRARYPLLGSLGWSYNKADVKQYVEAMDAYKKETA